MDDKIKKITNVCQKYLDEHYSLLNYIGFISHLALQTDETAQIAIEALYRDKNPQKYKKELEQIKKRGATKTLRLFKHFILEMALCRAVDNYLCYMSDLLAIIIMKRPEILRSSEIVKLDFILGFSDMKALISDLAEKKVNHLSYQGMRDLYTYMNEKLGFQIFQDEDQKERAVKIIEIRNLIVHARGIVTKIFKHKVPNFNLKLGKKIELSVTQTFNDVNFFSECVLYADEVAIKKFKLPGIKRKIILDKKPNSNAM